MQVSERLSIQMEKITINRISSERLVTPSPTLAVRKYVKLTRKSNTTAKEIALALWNDPLMAARIVCRAGGSQDSLEASVQKTGLQKVIALLTSASASTLANSGNIEIQQFTESLWKHSFAVALLAKDLTTILGVDTGESCFMTGLLHDVGRLTVSTMLLEAERAITNNARQQWVSADVWSSVLTSCAPSVEKALVESWPLPQTLKTLFEGGAEYDISERSSVANIVRFANALAESEGIGDGFTQEAESSALAMVGKSLLSIDEDLLQPIVQSLKSRVDEQF
jgi:HD-like signal output (HDOD) protein